MSSVNSILRPTANTKISTVLLHRSFLVRESHKVPPMRLNLFLIAAFCRLAKSLSHSEQMRWLVGAVGIEPTTFGLKGRCSTTELRP
jgi:hypothetical protein